MCDSDSLGGKTPKKLSLKGNKLMFALPTHKRLGESQHDESLNGLHSGLLWAEGHKFTKAENMTLASLHALS